MRNEYEDIMDAVNKDPLWWDENGTPRFAPFEPRMVPDIYAREAILMLIHCQNCETEFEVSLTSGIDGYVFLGTMFPLADRIKSGTVHYGDPPNTNCCPVGPSMNSVPVKVLQYWRRDYDKTFAWERVASLELEIENPFDELSEEELEAYNHTHEEE